MREWSEYLKIFDNLLVFFKRKQKPSADKYILFNMPK